MASVKGPVGESATATPTALPVNGSPCFFASARDIRLLPLTLVHCGWSEEAEGALRLRFAAQGVPMNAWEVDSLRFFFPGEYAAKRYVFRCGKAQVTDIFHAADYSGEDKVRRLGTHRGMKKINHSKIIGILHMRFLGKGEIAFRT